MNRQKTKDLRPKLTTYKSPNQPKMRIVCQLVILEICLLLLSVAHLQPTLAFVEAWNIYLKNCILFKIVLTKPDFWDSLFGQEKNIALCLKKYRKNGLHLRLVAYVSNKLFQIMGLINVHISVYQHAKCDCRIWKVWVFFGQYIIPICHNILAT